MCLCANLWQKLQNLVKRSALYKLNARGIRVVSSLLRQLFSQPCLLNSFPLFTHFSPYPSQKAIHEQGRGIQDLWQHEFRDTGSPLSFNLIHQVGLKSIDFLRFLLSWWPKYFWYENSHATLGTCFDQFPSCILIRYGVFKVQTTSLFVWGVCNNPIDNNASTML